MQEKLVARYGDPIKEQKEVERKWLYAWDIPSNFCTHIPALPNRLICNRDLTPILKTWFQQMINEGLYREIRTFEGCYDPGYVHGSKTKLSLQSWGLAIKFNAADNPDGLTRDECLERGLSPFSKQFLLTAENCFLTSGGSIKRPNRMCFEYTGEVK